MTACKSLTDADNRLPGQPVVGLNVNQFAGGSFDAAGQAFTKELGVHSIRVGYNHGNHNFGVNWAAQNGMGVVFMLGYSKGCNPTTASGRQCYADRSAGLARTYGAKVQYWEVWNEWNGGYGFGQTCKGQPCNDLVMYTDLLCRTYAAVKAVQPNAIIVSAVTSGAHASWISKMYDAGGGNCMDAISVHPYVYHAGNSSTNVPVNAPASVAVDMFTKVITTIHDLGRQKTGRSIPILVTEEGRGAGNPASEQITAAYITQLYQRAQSIPFLEGIWWYSLKDVSDGYGLLRSNNTRKPAFAAFQAAAKE